MTTDETGAPVLIPVPATAFTEDSGYDATGEDSDNDVDEKRCGENDDEFLQVCDPELLAEATPRPHPESIHRDFASIAWQPANDCHDYYGFAPARSPPKITLAPTK